MPDIKHLVHIDVPAEAVYRAVTEQQGLAGWWTNECTAASEAGGVNTFRFGGRYYNEMEIIELTPNARVVWKCLEGDEQWIGTRIIFDIEDAGTKTILRFAHAEWKRAGDFFATCNYHWGLYMKSLKSYCETGTGKPFVDGG